MEQHTLWDTEKVQSLSRATHQQDLKGNRDTWGHVRQTVSGFHSFDLHLVLLSPPALASGYPRSASSLHPAASPSLSHSSPSAHPVPKSQHWVKWTAKGAQYSQKAEGFVPWETRNLCILQNTGRSFTSSFYRVLPCSCWWGAWWNNPNK